MGVCGVFSVRFVNEPFDAAGSNHLPSRHVSLVIPLDLRQLVQIIRRETRRTTDAGRGRVPHPVEAFEPRPIGKMKARDGIGRFVSALGEEKVRGALRNEVLLQFCGGHALAGLVQAGDYFGAASIAVSCGTSQPCAKAWNGRQRRKGFQTRELVPKAIDCASDQGVPEGDSAEALMAA